MNKATFERALKAVAAGKALKEVKVRNVETDVVLSIKSIRFDGVDDTIYIEVE